MTPKYFWPPINRLALTLLVLAGLIISLWPLFKPGLYLGADGELHLGRITAYTRALQQGQFPVRWSDQLQYGYGSPIFIVTYPLPYLIGSLFLMTGLSLTLVFKLLIGLAVLWGAIGVYLAGMSWAKKPWLAVAIMIIYTLAPYHLVNAYLRVAIGELFLLTWPGWWLWCYFKTSQTKRLRWLVLMSLFGTAIILSHQLLGGLTLLVLSIMALTANQIKHQLNWWSWVKVMTLTNILSLLMSAWYWLPAYKESSYTMLKAMLITKPVTDYLLSFTQIFYQPWVIDWQAVPAMLGIPLTLAWLMMSFLTFKKQIPIWPWLMTTGAMILCLDITKSLWQNIGLLHYFQTPWRLMNLAVLSLCLGLIYVSHVKWLSKLIIVVAILMLVDAGIKLQLFQPQPIDESYYSSYAKSTAWHWEGTPVWTAGDATGYPTQPVEIIGPAQLNNWQKNSLIHDGVVTATGAATLVDHTFYFPGWTAYIDGQKVPIEFQNMNYRGLITLDISAGQHQVKLQFQRTKTRLMSELISVFGLGLVVVLILMTHTFQPMIMGSINQVKKHP